MTNKERIVACVVIGMCCWILTTDGWVWAQRWRFRAPTQQRLDEPRLEQQQQSKIYPEEESLLAPLVPVPRQVQELRLLEPYQKSDEQSAGKESAVEEVTPQALNLYDIEQMVVAYTNAQRITAGLHPLLIDKTLIRASRKHTIWMARNGNMRHGNLEGARAENIAAGQRDAQQVVATWMNSAGHKANILGTHRWIGVACFKASNGTMYWTQQFK